MGFYLNGRRIFLKSLHGNWYDPVNIQGTPRDMTWIGKDMPQLKIAELNMMRYLVSASTTAADNARARTMQRKRMTP
jgi:hypothetical protein